MNDTDDKHEDTEVELTAMIWQALASNNMPMVNRPALRSRLLGKANASLRAQTGWVTVRARDGEWHDVKSGVRAKTLWDGSHSSSILIEMLPGASLPVHRHASLEEGIVLSGGFQLDGKEFGPGDYHMSNAGSRHGRITSLHGVLAYLRGTSLGHTGAMIGELVSALLPGSGAPAVTITANDGVWEEIADGVKSKILCRDGEMVSRFIKLEAGSSLPANRCASEEECMMLEGDAFFGDRLLCAGDFHLTPEGAERAVLMSDGGALLFVRSGQD